MSMESVNMRYLEAMDDQFEEILKSGDSDDLDAFVRILETLEYYDLAKQYASEFAAFRDKHITALKEEEATYQSMQYGV